jgi:hypothetical protein
VPANGHQWYIAGSKQVVDDLATALHGSG